MQIISLKRPITVPIARDGVAEPVLSVRVLRSLDAGYRGNDGNIGFTFNGVSIGRLGIVDVDKFFVVIAADNIDSMAEVK